MNIERNCLEKGITSVITTEKDAAKLKGLLKTLSLKMEFLALGIELKITENEEQFLGLVSGKDYAHPFNILILSDRKSGHLNQSKAIAGMLRQGMSDRVARNGAVNTAIMEVGFKNAFYRAALSVCAFFSGSFCGNCLRCLRFCLDKETFRKLIQAPAGIIISAGSALSAVNLFLSYRNKARTIVVMKPSMLSLRRFDLAIIPRHDRIKKKDNVLLTRIAPNLIDQGYLQEQAGILKTRYHIPDTRDRGSGPSIGLLIGGSNNRYRMNVDLMDLVVSEIKQAAESLGAEILATTSRRTPEAVAQLLKDRLAGFSQCKLLVVANEGNIPEAVGGILGISDIIVVSGESISMVSEAVSAEKYVLVFELPKKDALQTKQERFLKDLSDEGILKTVSAGNLSAEIQSLWRQRPPQKRIEDKDFIYQALAEVISR